MNLTTHLDDTLRRWPGPMATLPITWWPTWAMPCLNDTRRTLLRSAVAAVRARQAKAGLDEALQRLDDRLLRDVGIDPSTVRRPPAVDLNRWLFNPGGVMERPLRAAGTLERSHSSEEERRYARYLASTYGKLD